LQEKPIYLFEQKYLTREAKKGRKKKLRRGKSFSRSISTSHRGKQLFPSSTHHHPQPSSERERMYLTRRGGKKVRNLFCSLNILIDE
jgi:hypothetical protein